MARPGHVVGLAASAGGLAALSQVLSSLPVDFAAALLVVQHVDPRHRSWLAEILDRRVGLPVTQVQGGERIAAGTVYVAPPDHHLLLRRNGTLVLSDLARVQYVRPSADLLFTSLARSWREGAIAVVLTGTGRDGAAGVLAVWEHGGTVIAQDEASSEFFGMPDAACRTGVMDQVLPLDRIASALVALTQRRRGLSVERQRPKERGEESPASDFVKLLDYLKTTRGFDFSGYKLSSLIRRVQKRMQQVGVASYSDYIDHLEVRPDEFLPLFNTVLINVTAFFRDPEAWRTLSEQILPRIIESKGAGEPIRCWSAGCASGEEAYTLAILLAEALGEQELRQRVKIYATDADEEALAQARQGSYTAVQVADVPEALRERYFERVGERYVFRPDLRRTLIFGRHDLVQDAAISRLDLLVCRNTLMYFNSETQGKILSRFHFALNRSGYLFLGKAETLLSHNISFRPEDLKARIFQRSPSASVRERMLAFAPATGSTDAQARPLRVREAAVDASPVAQIAVDLKGHLVLANERARKLFNLAPTDLGRPLQDLELSYRPVELRSHIDSARSSRMALTLKSVEWRPVGGETRALEIHVNPLMDSSGSLLGTGVTFLDQTLQSQLHADLERANQELETAYEELQSANEELETTNEELQSTVEELETTNEELQSANEELETMNEELQSTNEELRSINDQLQLRSEELRHVNSHLHSILSSLRAAVVVLNSQLEVEVWSDKAQDLWGLRDDEVQRQPFLKLDIGLPVAKLEAPILRCLDSGPQNAEVVLEGINRRGRALRCRVTCTRLGDGVALAGVMLLMEEDSEPPVSGSSDVQPQG